MVIRTNVAPANANPTTYQSEVVTQPFQAPRSADWHDLWVSGLDRSSQLILRCGGTSSRGRAGRDVAVPPLSPRGLKAPFDTGFSRLAGVGKPTKGGL